MTKGYIQDYIQTLGLALLASSNSIAAALSFTGAYYVVIAICILTFMLSRKLLYQKSIITILFLVSFCFISGLVLSEGTSSPVSYHYGLFCLSFGFALYMGNVRIDILRFFKYMVVIGVVCSPFLYLKARALAALVFTLESESGTMMGMTYAIVPTILSAVALLMLKCGVKWKIVSVYLIALFSFILILIGSRGAFVVFLVFFMLVLGTIIIEKKLFKILFLLFFGTIAAIVIVNFDNYLLAFNDILGSRGYSVYAVTKAVNKMGADSFSSGRTDIWQIAINGFLENPFGHWVGSFEEKYNLHQHNFILQMMWEFGLLGLIMAISIIVKSAVHLFANNNSKDKQLFFITIFCSSLIILLYSGTFWMLPCFWVWLRILNNKLQYHYE